MDFMGITMKAIFRVIEYLLITLFLAGCGGAGNGNTSAPPPDTTASTALITSYLSTTYANEQALVAIDLQSYNGSGASLVAIVNTKQSRVQTFLTNAITYIQTVKQSNAINKTAIAILFTNYQGSDLSFLQNSIFSGTAGQLGQTYTPAINSYYALAAAQLNAI